MPNPTILIHGRVGTDIETRAVGEGTVSRFRVITNDRVKVGEEWEDRRTSGWSIETWDKLSAKVGEHLEKGDPVTITGTIYEDAWTDKEGVKKYSTVVRADTVGLDVKLAKVK